MQSEPRTQDARPEPHRFTAEVVAASDTRIMRRSGRSDREVAVDVRRDGKRFQTFVIVVARSLLRAAGGDESDATARAVARTMEPTIKHMIADGTAPAATEIELRLTDEAGLAAMLRGSERSDFSDEPRFA